ncbi:hypothetical protein K2Y11_22490 [bacterium]|nr:hypothetical protein [bacterium]
MTAVVPRLQHQRGFTVMIRKTTTSESRIVDASLPSTFAQVSKDGTRFRQSLEDACVRRWGAISITKAATINTACRCERAARIAGLTLRRNIAALEPLQRVELQEKIVKFSERRDAAIMRLQLDNDPKANHNILDVAFDPTKEGGNDES